jgi:DNA polymerase III epsilon subunit-like protein
MAFINYLKKNNNIDLDLDNYTKDQLKEIILSNERLISLKLAFKQNFRTIKEIPMALRVAIIDLETTGIDFKLPIYPVQVSAILYKCSFHGREGREIKTFNKYVYPEDYEIPEESIKIHGKTPEFLMKYGENLELVIKELYDEIIDKADIICCHNTKYDIRVLLNLYKMKKMDRQFNGTFNMPSICTMIVGRYICRILKEFTRQDGEKYMDYKYPSLIEFYKYLTGEDFKGAHNSLNDVKATKIILIKLLENRTYLHLIRKEFPKIFTYIDERITKHILNTESLLQY